MTPPNPRPTIRPAEAWRRWRNSGIVLGMLVLLVVCLPVLVPVALVTRWRMHRAIRRAARTASCPRCGSPLGKDALPRAQRRWDAEFADYQRRHPGVQVNFPRPYDAACPACDATLAFRLHSRTFEPVSSGL